MFNFKKHFIEYPYFPVVLSVFIIALIKVTWLWFFFPYWQELSPEKIICDWVIRHEDYSYFLKPVDNFFNYGKYEFIAGNPYAARMPGYWIIYMGLRFLWEQCTALQMLMALQFVMEVFSVWWLGRIALRMGCSQKVSYWVMLLYALSPFMTIYAVQTVTESFSVSVLILSVYLLLRYLQGRSQWRLFALGIALTWLVFMRPFYIFILPFFGIIALWPLQNLPRQFKLLLLFSLPFLLAETAWVARNYAVKGQLQLTEDAGDYGREYSKGWLAIRRLIFRWGEDGQYVDREGVRKWFQTYSDSVEFQLSPAFFEGVNYTSADVRELRALYQTSRMVENESDFLKLDDQVRTRAELMAEEFADAQPFKAYFVAHFKILKRMFLVSGSGYLPFAPWPTLSLKEQCIKLGQSALYYLGLISLFAGCLMPRWKGRVYILMISFAAAMLIGLLLVVSDSLENRYLFGIYPMGLLAFGLVIQWILSRFNIFDSNPELT